MIYLIPLKRLLFKILGKNPAKMPMVKYWKTGEAVQAKITTLNGAQVMWLEGEDYPFPGFPRGWLLYSTLSKLKHEIKNQIFNESWKLLEEGATDEEVATHVRAKLYNIYALFKPMRIDMIPPEKMAPPVREFYRAWSKVAPRSILKDIVTMIIQEDDAYRWRLQWIVSYFGFGTPAQRFIRGLQWLEHAEVIGDMKERIRLVRRIVGTLLKDKENARIFNQFFREIDWKKMKMTEADKYYFRAKYFKVDLDWFDY